MASDQENTAAGNRRLEETPPPREQEVPATGAHPREAPLQEIIFPDVDPETAVLPPFHLSVSLEIEAADKFPPVLVFEKRLKSSDISGASRFRRLFISEGRRLSQALKAEEMHSVEGGGLSVRAVDPRAFHYDLLLTPGGRRPMEFNLRGGWIDVVKENRLKVGDRVEGWGFRVQGIFRLALHIIKQEQVQLALGI